jgi:signal recognition particle GTPase
MQKNANHMEQIAYLVKKSEPDMTLFVAAASVGGIIVEQIQLFHEKLQHVCKSGGQAARGLDGIILTKWDRDSTTGIFRR